MDGWEQQRQVWSRVGEGWEPPPPPKVGGRGWVWSRVGDEWNPIKVGGRRPKWSRVGMRSCSSLRLIVGGLQVVWASTNAKAHYGTGDSRVIPQHSTNPAQSSLTSEF